MISANAVLVVVSKVLDAVCKAEVCPLLSKARYYQIFISVEVLIALIVLVVYLGELTVKGNSHLDSDFLIKSYKDFSCSDQIVLADMPTATIWP